MTSRNSARRHRGRHTPRAPQQRAERINPSRRFHWAEGTQQFWCDHVDRPLFVYFIRAGSPGHGPVKIGKALDPQKRLAELQCGNPVDLYIREVILANDETESTLHTFLRRDALVRGEWFGQGWEDIILAYANAAMHRQIDMFLEGRSLPEVTDEAIYMAYSLIKRVAA